jgi:dihydrodipicolinate synthase/N-acetylneuraminate lyase
MLNGVWVPVITTFDERGRFDAAKQRALLELLSARPVAGFVVLGSTGEACLLTEGERDAVVSAARRAVPRSPLLVGTGAESTALAVDRTRRAVDRGADGVLVLAPGFYRRALSLRSLMAHYETVGRASRVPVFLYQFPQANGFAFPPGSIRRLRTLPRIVGIKDSSGERESIRMLIREGGRGFDVAVGSARRFLGAMEAGASGAVLAVANIAPGMCARLLEAFERGRPAEARRLQRLLIELLDALGSSGPSGFKASLELVGFPAGPPRAPLCAPSPADRARILRALRRVRLEAGP